MDRNEQQVKLAAAFSRLQKLKLTECIDPTLLDSRPNKKQKEVLDDLGKISHRYVVAGNQAGKSQLGAREVAWVFSETHPTWKRPKAWQDESLLMLVVGRVSQQVEEVLWRKISGFLDLSQVKIVRQGGALQKAIHIPTGNTIIFASHHSDNEAREKLQAYVAHYVWVDEMPKSHKLIEELHRRVQARDGYFLATFTPKVRNEEIKNLVESARPPLAKKYKMSMLDNPIYEGREDSIVESMKTYSEAYRNTVLYGDWSSGEDAVYDFKFDEHVEAPEGYHPSWRHMEAVDPATMGKMGTTVWAEHPVTGIWYCIKAEYIEKIYGSDEIVGEAQKYCQGLNITRRVADTQASWYFASATKLGIKPPYLKVWNKKERKLDLIQALQDALGKEIKIAPWCTKLIDEFTTCEWSENGENKIVNASRFHLLDSAQYFVDLKPKYEKSTAHMDWSTWLYTENEKRKQKIDAEKKKKARTKAKIGRRKRLWA